MRPVNLGFRGYSSHFVISIVIRSIQFLWTIIALATAAASDANFPNERIQFSLAVSVISFAYLVFTVTPLYRYAVPLSVIICESILTLLWLVAFAVVADFWASVSCSFGSGHFWGFSYSSNGCTSGKANIAFAFLAWITFILSLVLSIIFTVIPSVKSGTQGLFTKNISIGSIFPVTNFAVSEDANLEAGLPVEREESDQKELPEPTTESGYNEEPPHISTTDVATPPVSEPVVGSDTAPLHEAKVLKE
ncbi:hypothetical protein CAAN1_26S01354 [[Candida] anglica]|uniref:MARVEL domain-containing protein n=1 Tax=[Candida] anglica TaxID=148631 RepID=A0ABP0EHL4_9ASCO